MSTMTLPQTNGSRTVKSEAAWLTSSVQAFFSGVNWDDHSPEVQEAVRSSSHGSNTPLSLTLSVSQFFAAVNWDGVEIAAAPAAAAESAAPAKPADDLTLDDFSSLF